MRKAFLVSCAAWVLLAACEDSYAAGKGKYTPGADKSFPWQNLDYNKTLEAGKPVLLYVYEPVPGNPTAEELEKQVFPNPGLKEAFADYLHVKISSIDRAWPPPIVQCGAKGAVVILMTCDGRILYMCGKGNMPRFVVGADKIRIYPDLVAAAKAVRERNVKAQEDVKKKPPLKYVPPGQDADVAVEAEQEKPKGVAGLLGGGEEDGRKPEGGGCGRKAGGEKKHDGEKKAAGEKKTGGARKDIEEDE